MSTLSDDREVATVQRVRYRDDSIATIKWLNDRLRGVGWTRYREGELIDPDKECVVRTGYAGGECEVELKRPRVCGYHRDIDLGTLRLHRGDINEMRMECEQWLFENTGYRL